MKRYEVVIEDIYEKGSSKKMHIDAINAQLAHKQGLKQTNALREEISKIFHDGKPVYSFKGGFLEDN